MAGESHVSVPAIEQRAVELEDKLANPPAPEVKPPEGQAGAPAPEVKQPAPEVKPPEPPKEDSELRKWATKLSMENADIRRELQNLAGALSRAQKKPMDWKALAKDPDKLEKAVEAHNKELEEGYQKQYSELTNQQTAELTDTISRLRSYDTQNYPRWAELLPVMRQLASIKDGVGDTRVNFNQHPNLVLDELYALAVKVTSEDPNYKKPAPAGVAKTYTQAELDAKVAEATKAAQDSAAAQRNGVGVGSMGKGAPKGKPGNELDKEAAWNMPMGALKDAIQKATENLR